MLGIRLFFRTERNARIEAGIAGLTFLAGIWLRISWHEWCILLLCTGAVLSAEAFNSAIEKLADFCTRDTHAEIGNLKDIAAGAVLILAMMSAGIGIIILFPKLLVRLGTL